MEKNLEDYQIFIWGSTVDNRTDRPPIDLDIIIEYYSSPIDSKKTDHIESRLMEEINISEFNYLDPTIIHKNQLESLVYKSRVSKIYNIDKDSWIYF